MADPTHGRDNSIDSVLSDGSQTSKGGTPRRAHPALFPKATTTSETQGTIRVAKLASPTARTNSGGLTSAFDDLEGQDSPLAGPASRKKRQESNSPTPSTPSNISSGKGSKGRSSVSRRARMKSRKSITGPGVSEDESSASEGEGGSARMFETAFQKYDINNEDQIPMSDFLHFFDTLQAQLPPLSEPLLRPEVREQMLKLMSQVMSQSDGPIYVSKEETKGFYKAIAGKDITQELNDRRHGTFPQGGGEVSSFRGRLAAANIQEETPRRPTVNTSPERRTPYGGAFARPLGPRRQQSTSTGPMGEGTDDDASDLQSGDPSLELTGNFLASSTPAKQVRTTGHGYFSPPVTSPTHSQLSFGDFPAGRNMASPGFNTSAALESELAATHRDLRQKQLDYIEKEQELSDLKRTVDRNREEFDEEIAALTDESTRLRGELEQKRREIIDINKEKDELRAEAAVYLDQVSEAKREIEQFHHQHDIDRENILSLSQDSQRYAQQAADALRRVDALTADLQTVMRQKEEVEAQKASYQKKADLMTKLHKQIKDLQEAQKDREFEIERLKSELHSRQLDIEMMMTGGNPASGALSSKGRIRDSVGPGIIGLLSDELEGADGGSSDEEDEDEEEDEVITTTKVTRRKKTSGKKKGGSVVADAGSESFEVVERVVETHDRGVQAETPKPKMAEMGTDMDDELPVQMFSAQVQTDVAIDVGTSLEEHFETLSSPPPAPIEFSIDEEGFQNISRYEELAKEAELTKKQLEEFSNLIGVQSEVIERLISLGEANAKHKVKIRKVVVEKRIASEDPIAYLNYATYWLQNWLRISLNQLLKKTEKGDEWAEFLEYNPQPNFTSVALLLILFISIGAMMFVTAVYTYKWQSHEAMWRKLNRLQGYPRYAGQDSGGIFGSRTWRVLKYDVQRMIYGQVRFPV
ncbi:hypothetical protein ABW19_dt0203517 [Dactylella cylindrospora]|nr:hypothetical protein ABW19_dt0203517 [Dactylella cylindrospora]